MAPVCSMKTPSTRSIPRPMPGRHRGEEAWTSWLPPGGDRCAVGKEGFTFKATVTVRPEVTLRQYKGLDGRQGPWPPLPTTDVENELQAVRRPRHPAWMHRGPCRRERATPWSSTLRASRTACPSTAARPRAMSLALGSGSFIPGFEEQRRGHARPATRRTIERHLPRELSRRGPGRQGRRRSR